MAFIYLFAFDTVVCGTVVISAEQTWGDAPCREQAGPGRLLGGESACTSP